MDDFLDGLQTVVNLVDIASKGLEFANKALNGASGATVAKSSEMYVSKKTHCPDSVREINKPFLMTIEDVFSIEGRGIVVTGRIERGIIKVNDNVEVVGLSAEPHRAVVTGIEMFNKTLDEGRAGDNVGCLLRGIKRDEIERGQVLAEPGSISPAHQVQSSGLRFEQG